MGDMDFKVAGLGEGITGFQMVFTLEGYPYEILGKGLPPRQRGR